MAIHGLTIAAAALLVLALGASAARDTGFGRELKQAVSVSASSPAVIVDATTPFNGFLGRMVSFLQNDAKMLRTNIQTGASNLNATVQQIPLVATFETDLANGLDAVQHNLNTAVLQGQEAGQGALKNLNTIIANIMMQGDNLLHQAQDALPPMPQLPAGITLPAGLPVINLPNQQVAMPAAAVQAQG